MAANIDVYFTDVSKIRMPTYENIVQEEGHPISSKLPMQQKAAALNQTSMSDAHVRPSPGSKQPNIPAPSEMDEYVYIDDSPPQNRPVQSVTTTPTIAERRRELLPTTFDGERVIRAEYDVYTYATEFDAPQSPTKKCSGNAKIWKGLAIVAVILVAIAVTAVVTRFTLRPEFNNPMPTNDTKDNTGTPCHLHSPHCTCYS